MDIILGLKPFESIDTRRYRLAAMYGGRWHRDDQGSSSGTIYVPGPPAGGTDMGSHAQGP